jgi:cold shock CspA family protein
MSFTSGTLVYWNTHSGFGEIELDDRDGRIGIYRSDLLRAGVRAPLVGDRFHFNTGVAANGLTVAIGLGPDIG